MNINFFSISNFDRAFILARKSDGTLPGSVRDNLDNEEEKELLEIIEDFEKNPTDISNKSEKYEKLMKLYYKGVGLKEDGTGTISKENERGALELAGLINDAILQDQQNIDGDYSSSDLKKALELQNKFRKDLEKNTSLKSLLSSDKGIDNEINAWQKEYQTEKITSYLAENKDKFKSIFEKLSGSGSLNSEEKEMLTNLQKLAAGKNGQNVLNTILGTFKEFKDYDFTDSKLTKMKKSSDSKLLEQAETQSTFSNWERIAKTNESERNEDDDDDDKENCSCDDNNSTRRILNRISRRLERLENNTRENNDDNMPGWLQAINAGIGVAGNFLRTTGLGGYGNCCYTPSPCYDHGGGYNPGNFCKTPIYTDGDTWPWGRSGGGIASNSFGFGSYMPSSSSVSSNPFSSSTSNSNPSNNNYSPINVTVNPVFNNNPNQSNSSLIRNTPSFSSNQYEIKQQFRPSGHYYNT